MKTSGMVITVLVAACLSGPLFALSEGRIAAWPVPFNPATQTLKIGYHGAAPDALDRVRIEIFDINGDLVYEARHSNLDSPVIWSGRNSGGRRVHPGMYIIKITAENTATGEMARRVIRILVAR